MTRRVNVIGGGIVGLATAYRLLERDPARRVTVLEKEPAPARHQSGRNSGVLHSGIYYVPGSAKARNCRAGKAALESFCERHGIPFERCGKVIVAVDESELPALERIHERGRKNGVRCERIDEARLAELEPAARGVAALHVPDAGIVDYRRVCDALVERILAAGGSVRTAAAVRGIVSRGGVSVVESEAGEFEAELTVNCGGLHADRIARLAGHAPGVRIVPFRGEYWMLRPQARRLCRSLIYPVPDPRFPFLGVHFTRRIGGAVECGPNAVPALAREGYRWRDVHPRDLAQMLGSTGFLRFSARHWRTGLGEIHRSLSPASMVRALRRLVPELERGDLERAPAGVRAQAMTPDGRLVDDFAIESHGRVIHVLNAPSPAATASLAIGETIASRAGRLLAA